MPYVVEPQPDGTYMVSCHWRMPITYLSQSEAHIIAWALNAVAEGKALVAEHVEWVTIQGEADDYDEPQRRRARYDGPTDRVAPFFSTKPD